MKIENQRKDTKLNKS